MVQRPDLHALLLTLCENVYFQPPADISMKYPCIVYNRDNIDIKHADNEPYAHKTRYSVMVIARHPDDPTSAKVARLPTVAYERFFTADNLNHDVFRLFY